MHSPSSSVQLKILLVIIGLVTLRLLVAFEPVSSGLSSVLGPLNRWAQTVAAEPNKPVVDGAVTQKARIAQLEAQLQQLQREQRSGDRLVTAPVIRKDIQGIRKFIVIDLPTDSKVKVGAPVLSSGWLVGRISALSGGTAQVQLITDPQFRVTAQAGQNVHGVLKTEQGSLIFDLVPQQHLEGERVVSDGIDGIFPPGLLIGVLGQEITTSQAVFERFQVILSQNPAQLSVVSVITGEL